MRHQVLKIGAVSCLLSFYPSSSASLLIQSTKKCLNGWSASIARTAYINLLLLCIAFPAMAVQPDEQRLEDDHSPGKVLFQKHCSHCHDAGVPRAPKTLYLKLMPAKTIYRALTDGAMRGQAQHLKDDEKQLVAEYLSGKPLLKAENQRPLLHCKNNPNWFDYNRQPVGRSWGIDKENTRFIPGDVSRLPVDDISRLKLKWAFAFPDAVRARSQPAIAGGALFVGSQDGTVYALDASSGCVHWAFKASAEVRTAIAITPWENGQPDKAPVLLFGDFFANAYAVNAVTGELVWKTKVDEHPHATLTGSPAFFQDTVYLPVSSLEIFSAGDPAYACCSFRGAIVALDSATGQPRWKTHTIPAVPTRPLESWQYGPSGAPVWNSPTIDAQRGLLYFGTGQNYSSPADDNSNAIFAIDLNDGHVVWKTQTLAGDAINVGCAMKDNPNCPAERGPDLDYGASPVLIKQGQQHVLVAGQKSGDVYGLNPSDGKVLWHKKVGRGSSSGGVHFGMAAEGATIFVPVFDPPRPDVSPGNPGLYALNGFTGKRRWSSPITEYCKGETCNGYSAAITAIAGALFACTRDGLCHGVDSSNGKLLWSFNTAQDFIALNGDKANGGAISGPGPVIADGIVYINSGYMHVTANKPGNVLLAFSIDGK